MKVEDITTIELRKLLKISARGVGNSLKTATIINELSKRNIKTKTKMSDYIKGQEDLIKYIKQQLLLMANNSPDETIMEDVVNFLQNLKPKRR